MEKIRSGGVYCKNCKICICKPRVRKYFLPESFIILCDKCCDPQNTLEITFRTREEAHLTNFIIKYEDINGLINQLKYSQQKRIE